MNILIRVSLVCLLSIICLQSLLSQQNPDLALTQAERDSILKDYDNIFPIYGREAVEAGFDLPLPGGININYYAANQGIDIRTLQLGVNQSEMYDANFIKFDDMTAKIASLSGRIDLWVLPFLNVYGIFAYGKTNSTVNVAAPIEFQSSVDLEGWGYGPGFTMAFGIKKYWTNVDMNWTWTNLDKFEKPVQARIMSFRIGRSFKIFNKKNKIAIWAGAMNQYFGSVTEGSLTLGEALPDLGDKLDDYQNTEWYQDLGRKEKLLVDQIATAIQDKELDKTLIKYAVDKAPSTPWNMLIGAQYEFDKHWCFRTELGFLGRTSLLLNLNYRFNI
jgi:hypothetical protein